MDNKTFTTGSQLYINGKALSTNATQAGKIFSILSAIVSSISAVYFVINSRIIPACVAFAFAILFIFVFIKLIHRTKKIENMMNTLKIDDYTYGELSCMLKNFCTETSIPAERTYRFYLNIPLLPEGIFTMGIVEKVYDNAITVAVYYEDTIMHFEFIFERHPTYRVDDKVIVQYAIGSNASGDFSSICARLIDIDAVRASGYDYKIFLI